MNKKCVSLTILIFFTIFIFNCSSYSKQTLQMENFETISTKKMQKFEVLRVVKTNGVVIEFDKDQPGYIDKNIIIGIVVDKTGAKKTKASFY
jgi:hypothetical protein